MKLADNKATLSFSNGSPSVDLPVYQGSIGPDVIDIRKLYAQTGMFTYDPGFLSTAATQSAITYIDGDKGELLYRGYPIEQLATQCDYLDTCYLLLNGELPNDGQRTDFHKLVTNHTMVNEQMQFFLRGFRRDAHPMAVLTGLVGALSAFYHDSTDINNPQHREIAAIRLIAKMPTLVAMAYKYGMGQPYMYPQNHLSYAGNFLRMMFGTPCEEYKVNPVLERALDRIFILHADHEQNASTSTVRLCGSSGTNPFAAIAAGVACLWGPAHGGANEAALNMLHDIQAQAAWRRSASLSSRSRTRTAASSSWALATACTRTTTPAPSSCKRLAMKCWPSWAWKTTRCSSWPRNWRRSPWKTNTSSPASSTPTWTSTPASCSAPSASR